MKLVSTFIFYILFIIYKIYKKFKKDINLSFFIISIFLAVGRREGIHESVAKDVTAIFKGKTAIQLEALQLQIEVKITGKPEGVDIGYWESLLSQLKGNLILYNFYTI